MNLNVSSSSGKNGLLRGSDSSSNTLVKTAFLKNYKNLPSGWGLRPSVILLSYVSLLNTSPTLDIFAFYTTSPFSKILLQCQTGPRLLIFHSTISLPHKKFLFRRFLITLLHVIYGLPPLQSKILATPMLINL